MASDDPAALAASTAQGWAYALNTVARPAPEHLEAAQEALNALERADRHAPAFGVRPRWLGVRNALAEALTAARLRVDGGRPEITVAQLTEAVGQLRELGLVPDPRVGSEDPDWPRPPAGYAQGYVAARRLQAEAAARVEELEEELEEANERAALTDAELRRQVDLRDRFERERDQLQRDLKAAHSSYSAVDAAREDSRRAGYVWCLAQLGNSLPGYDDMSTEELRELATKRLQEANLDGGTLRHVANELVRAGRRMALGLDGPLPRLDPERPIPLAAAVVELVEMTAREHADAVDRLRELEAVMEAAGWEDSDQLPQLRAAREERDMLTRARDAQAAELRALREERDDAERLIAELQEKLTELRRTAAEGAARQEAGRRRIAELEATLKAERDDDDEPGATLSELRSVRAERDGLEKRLAESQGRAESLEASLEYLRRHHEDHHRSDPDPQ